MSVIIPSPYFFGKWAVLRPDGTIIDCHNIATARQTRDAINAQNTKSK
jgi:hypothetical protein